MLRKRIIPCLLLKDDFLVKTIKFKNPKYVGDPINAITIFNDKEVDEIILLDIASSKEKKQINYQILEKIVKECFVPLTYGGGITDLKQMKQIYELGIEKIVINNSLLKNFTLLEEASSFFGSQSVIAGVDVKKNLFLNYKLFSHVNNKTQEINLANYIKKLENSGAGEVFLNSVDRDGTWLGYDVELCRKISENLKIPLIASGGAGSISHVRDLFEKTETMAAAIGSMAVYQKKDCGVLINFPLKSEREEILK